MTFAMITPALIVGSVVERVKFSPLMLFIVLWVTFVYFPIAHMVWYWEGPDAIAAAALKGKAALDAANADAGWLFTGARSTSPAARWCTSTPASPGWWGA